MKLTKEKPIKPTKKQLIIIKQYWKKLQELESKFLMRVRTLEAEMEKDTKIKNIEFFSCDGGYVGVGNADRTMDLIHLN